MTEWGGKNERRERSAKPSHPLVERYSEQVLAHTEFLSRVTRKEVLNRAMYSVIFKPAVERYVNTALENNAPPEVIADAIDFIASSALDIEDMYLRTRPRILENTTFLEALAKHHKFSATGDIVFLPPEFAMTPREAKSKVSFADDRLYGKPEVQRYLAKLTYAAYTDRTMCS